MRLLLRSIIFLTVIEVGLSWQREAETHQKRPSLVFRRCCAGLIFPLKWTFSAWLLQDTGIWSRTSFHDSDTYTAEKSRRNPSGGDCIKRTNEDGTESEFRVGDVKPGALSHSFEGSEKKMRASSLAKSLLQTTFISRAFRFLLSYARYYLTHSTFDSRKKYQYKVRDVRFSDVTASQSKTMFDTLYAGFGGGLVDTVERVVAHRAEIAASGAAEPQKELVRALCSAGDVEALGSLMSHAYFYKEFT